MQPPHRATWWPNECNMLDSTMLDNVPSTCCICLAIVFNIVERARGWALTVFHYDILFIILASLEPLLLVVEISGLTEEKKVFSKQSFGV